MSTETAVVVNISGQAIYWHLPEGRSAAYLPDVDGQYVVGRHQIKGEPQGIWGVIWENRDDILGIAHSHPGGGTPSPSHEDLTTFAATEAALGKQLTWWIMSRDQLAVFEWAGPGKYDYRMRWRVFVNDEIAADESSYDWVDKLHKLSYCAETTTAEQEEGECHGEQGLPD